MVVRKSQPLCFSKAGVRCCLIKLSITNVGIRTSMFNQNDYKKYKTYKKCTTIVFDSIILYGYGQM